MSTPDTITPDETFDPADLAGMLGPLGGLIPPELLSALSGAMTPDGDATTLDDVAESLDSLHSKLDWIADALRAVNGALPNRFAIELPDYPDE